MKTIDLVLPVYNEELGIVAFHQQLTLVLDSLADRYRFQLLYVLDRSTDNSLAVLTDLARGADNVTVIHLSRRFGHQMSLVAGLDHATGDAAIMMDTDLQHPPQLIPRLIELFEQGYDVVQTVRRYSDETRWSKGLMSSMFYALQNALSPVGIKDGMADFRLVSRRVVNVFQTSIREQNQFLRGLFQWVGFNRTELSFVSGERQVGLTKYSPRRLVAFSVTGIVSFSKVPLRVATLIGGSISVAGVCYAMWLLFEYARGGLFPPGYASLILVVLIIGGLQLMFLGVLGEYLGSIFDEVKRRPLYVVDGIIRRGSGK